MEHSNSWLADALIAAGLKPLADTETEPCQGDEEGDCLEFDEGFYDGNWEWHDWEIEGTHTTRTPVSTTKLVPPNGILRDPRESESTTPKPNSEGGTTPGTYCSTAVCHG